MQKRKKFHTYSVTLEPAALQRSLSMVLFDFLAELSST